MTPSGNRLLLRRPLPTISNHIEFEVARVPLPTISQHTEYTSEQLTRFKKTTTTDDLHQIALHQDKQSHSNRRKVNIQESGDDGAG